MSEMDHPERSLVWISQRAVNQLARGREMTRTEAKELITNQGWAPHRFVDTPPRESQLGRDAVLTYIPLGSTNQRPVTYLGLPAEAARSVLAARRRSPQPRLTPALPPPPAGTRPIPSSPLRR